MISRSELEGWSHDERSELMRMLVELEVPANEPAAAPLRRRNLVRLVATVGAVVLVPWTIYLAATLPRLVLASRWRGAWVGFDVLLVIILSSTAWLGWKGRQMVVVGLVASSVLLVCDAWFDVMLTRGPDHVWSVATAVLVELPVAALFAVAARAIFAGTSAFVWTATGRSGPIPPLHRMPIVMQLRDGSVGSGGVDA